MKGLHYIGLDVHKKTISYVIKTYAGQLVDRGQVTASRPTLTAWAATTAAALERSAGSDDVHGLSLRLPAAARPALGGGPSGDAASHRLRQEEERLARRREDLRPVALRPAPNCLPGKQALLARFRWTCRR